MFLSAVTLLAEAAATSEPVQFRIDVPLLHRMLCVKAHKRLLFSLPKRVQVTWTAIQEGRLLWFDCRILNLWRLQMSLSSFELHSLDLQYIIQSFPVWELASRFYHKIFDSCHCDNWICWGGANLVTTHFWRGNFLKKRAGQALSWGVLFLAKSPHKAKKNLHRSPYIVWTKLY
jgi:hypothetical protein